MGEKNNFKLHYIWFKKYRTFENQGFNLSKKYNFSYDPKNEKCVTVSTDTCDRYVDNFFGDNIDLTAIVGENGTGKTSLLEFINDLRYNNIIEYNCVIVCEVDSEFWAGHYYRNNIDNKIKCEQLSFKGCKIPEKEHEKNLNDFLEQRLFLSIGTRFIYNTEMLNTEHYINLTPGNHDDLSLASLLRHQAAEAPEEKHNNDIILKYIHRITDRQINFVSNGREFIEGFGIKYPQYLSVDFSYDKYAYEKLYVTIKKPDKAITASSDDDELKKQARFFLWDLLKKDNTKTPDLKDNFAEAILMNIISSLDYTSNIYEEQKALFGIIGQTSNYKGENAWSMVCKILERINDNNNDYMNTINDKDIEHNKDNYCYITVDANKYISFMEYLDDFLSYSSKDNTYYESNGNGIYIPTDNMEVIKEFYNEYKETVSMVEFLTFSWGLSSGETLLLNQFGKFLHILKNRDKKYYLPKSDSDEPAENAIIMLDEAEVAFHPEWQRRYLNCFLKFINKNICEQGTHVHLIIATHSPIILSDIPRQNIIFFKKEENGTVIDKGIETFAANIFSLYRSAFFLDEVGIGVFAEEKLGELIDKMNDSYNKKNCDKTIEEIEREIACIGDPYLRHKFETEYIRLFKNDLDDEIRKTKSRLKRLYELKEERKKSGERNAQN